MTDQEWYMNPMERLMLSGWLNQYNGHMILNADVLSELEVYGLKWSREGRRLSYMAESVTVPVYTPAYFNKELEKASGRGTLLDGNWLGVWALDVASAILTLALGQNDPTTALHARANRYNMIVTMLRPEAPVQEASGMVGEIRG
jgi:hypothetical protein